MVRGDPCMCMATHPTGPPAGPAPAPAATSHSEAEMSLSSVAPASTAATATAGFTVSTEIRTAPARAAMTGMTRASSSSTEIATAPGREDSPPTSTMSAPAATRANPWATARSVVS